METFQFGRTISRIFELMRAAIVPVGIFTLIVQFVSLAINWAMMRQLGAAMQDPSHPFAGILSPWYWLLILLSMAAGGMLWPGVISGYLKASRGEPFSVGDCFRAGFSMLLPVFAITILWLLGMMLGWMLLLVPGIILTVMWSVVLPAYVGEQTGIFGSFGRSRALTKGARWKILAVLIVALVIMYAPLVALSTVLPGSISPMMDKGSADVGYYLVMLPYGWALSMFLGALLTSIYLEARLVHGDVDGSAIAEVFG